MLIQSFVIAFAMYSALPMPRVDWNRENMQYALCFFPLIGGVIGAGIALWRFACSLLGLSPILFAAGAVLLPVLVTGGIHLDGFCDTVDALSSRRDREEKLQILKDPHTGAFAVIGLCCLFLVSFALWQELDANGETLSILGSGFVLSRCLSGLAVASVPLAKDTGLAYTFANMSAKGRVRAWLAIFALLCIAGMAVLIPLEGGACACASLFCFVLYYRMAKRQFGGITGDLAGYFLEVCECSQLFAVLFVQKLF